MLFFHLLHNERYMNVLFWSTVINMVYTDDKQKISNKLWTINFPDLNAPVPSCFNVCLLCMSYTKIVPPFPCWNLTMQTHWLIKPFNTADLVFRQYEPCLTQAVSTIASVNTKLPCIIYIFIALSKGHIYSSFVLCSYQPNTIVLKYFLRDFVTWPTSNYQLWMAYLLILYFIYYIFGNVSWKICKDCGPIGLKIYWQLCAKMQ